MNVSSPPDLATGCLVSLSGCVLSRICLVSGVVEGIDAAIDAQLRKYYQLAYVPCLAAEMGGRR